MSKAKMFRRARDKILDDVQEKVDRLVSAADERLEALAVNTFGKPDPSSEELFAPPAVPIKVKCLHCGGRYLSDKMRLEYRPRMQHLICESLGDGFTRLGPLWWCKNAGCDGAGFGHDLHPVAGRKRAARP